MTQPLEALAQMEYPGRGIIVGQDRAGEHNIVVYFLTGRSASSKARKLVEVEDGTIKTEVTDPAQVAKGNPALLLYNAIVPVGRSVIVSNGAQTDFIAQVFRDRFSMAESVHPYDVLVSAFARPHAVPDGKGGEIDVTTFEPDAPNYTPRISGFVQPDWATLHIVLRTPSGEPYSRPYVSPYLSGKGNLITTYSGTNESPLPSFSGNPLLVELKERSAFDTMSAVYDALKAEYRVDVVAMFINKNTGIKSVAIASRDL